MDFERWVSSKIESLKMKTMAENSRMPIPKKVLEKVSKCDPNDKNAHGETILTSVVRYINDEMRQVKYLQVLLRAGADQNLGDSRHGKTPLMFACQEKKRAACRILINHPSVNPSIKDNLGNTALTYANHSGDPYIVTILTTELDEIDVTMAKKIKDMGHEKQLHLLQTMHQQLALVKSNKNIKDLSDFQAYKSGKLWLQKSLSLHSFPSVSSSPKEEIEGEEKINSPIDISLIDQDVGPK